MVFQKGIDEVLCNYIIKFKSNKTQIFNNQNMNDEKIQIKLFSSKNLSATELNQLKELINFNFQHSDTKLTVKAITPKRIYLCTIEPIPDISFEDIQTNLTQKNFDIKNFDDETLEIILCKLKRLTFKSFEYITIEQLKEKSSKLEEIFKNNQSNVNSVIKELGNKLDAIQSNYQKLDAIKSNYQKSEKQKTTKIQLLEKQLSQVKKSTCQLMKTESEKNRESKQQITKLTSELTQYKKQLDQLISQKNQKNCLAQEIQFMKQSTVVCTLEEKQIIQKFFSKTIKTIKLLYRASENNFCVGKFHEKCDGIANTLTVIRTEFNKKIGGFTPLKWKSPQNYEYSTDNQKESFIFSLTQNEKFTLQQPAKAISNHLTWGPMFGAQCDLAVYHKSNQKNNSYANICSDYHNQKYKKDDKASWQRFTGNAKGHCNFKTLQWQVWALEFA